MLPLSGETCIDSFTPALRGDVDFDGRLDAMDSVIANCVVSGMLTNGLSLRLADTNNNVAADENDVLRFERSGLMI